MTTIFSQSSDNQRAIVLLPGGGLLDLLDPLPGSWTDEDLAIGLSRTYRWGGHSAWSRPLSVAQHSLTVLAIREQQHGRLGPDASLYELLHDAEEGLIGFDCIAPLKPFLGAPFADLCTRLTAAIARRYGLVPLMEAEWRLHKQADRTAAASEALHVVKWSRDAIRTSLRIAEIPLEIDPLDTGDFAPWEPWPSDYAARRWLEAVEQQYRRIYPAAASSRQS